MLIWIIKAMSIKGVYYLLNGQNDKAKQAYIEAIHIINCARSAVATADHNAATQSDVSTGLLTATQEISGSEWEAFLLTSDALDLNSAFSGPSTLTIQNSSDSGVSELCPPNARADSDESSVASIVRPDEEVNTLVQSLLPLLNALLCFVTDKNFENLPENTRLIYDSFAPQLGALISLQVENNAVNNNVKASNDFTRKIYDLINTLQKMKLFFDQKYAIELSSVLLLHAYLLMEHNFLIRGTPSLTLPEIISYYYL